MRPKKISAPPCRWSSEVGFAGAYSFKYSARPGTPAAEHGAEQVPEQTKSERLRRLQSLIDRQQAAFNQACRGKTFDVLFEKSGRHPGQLVGRSPYLQPVHVQAGSHLIGDICQVTIAGIDANSLFGVLAGQAERTAEPIFAEAGG